MIAEFEWSIDFLIQLGTLIGILAIGITWLYQRGKHAGTREACIVRIEENQKRIIGKIDKIKARIGEDREGSDDVHETLENRITTVEKDVAYIRGKIDQALEKH